MKSFKDEEDRVPGREEDGVGKSFVEVKDWWDSECFCCLVF